MPRVHTLQPSFNAGELSPRLAARLDFVKYASGCETCLNFVPLAEGGLMRRPGSRYVAELKSSAVKGRLFPFEFSTTQAYILEFGESVIRFYRNQGQITASNIGASITNGTFDTAITSWTDSSTGTAQISHILVGSAVEGTFDASQSTTIQWGDGVAGAANAALKFTAATTGDLLSITANVVAVSAAMTNTVARIYTNNAGSPGTQVGGNSASVAVSTTGDKVYTWSSSVPPLVSGTTYWVILSDTSGGSGDVTLSTASDQGAAFASGRSDTITSIVDDAAGDFRIKITFTPGTAEGALNLEGAGSSIAIAEQQVPAIQVSLNTAHTLRFRVFGGVAGDEIKLRAGTASGGTDILNDLICKQGYHSVEFTTVGSSFLYLQFRNEAAKDIYIDDVAFLDNTAMELTTPYAEADLGTLNGPQSADVLYLCHASYPLAKLLRRGHTDWSLEEVEPVDGPYLDQNDTATTLTPGATTGLGITLTASAVGGINGGRGFLSTDVGRVVRILHSSTWGYGVITAVTSTTVATIDIKRNFGATGAVTTWRLGSWSGTTGYPSTGAFFEQRLFLAATTDQPQTLWASQTSDFENFRPDSDASGGGVEVQDDDALDFTLSADDVNAIRWLSAGEDTLAIGTTGGEWVPSSQGAVLTPSDITIRRQTTHGSAQVQPIRVDNIVLFVQRAGRKVREFGFSFEIDGFTAPDMTRLSYHLTQGGIVEMAYQQEPDSVVWAVRNDGVLLSMTYRRDEDVVGWSRHILGGAFGSGNAVVESVAVIPGADAVGQTQSSADRNEVWLIVKRTVDGNTVRYVEFLERDYEEDDAAEDAYYLDSALTYDGASTTSITGLDHLEGQTVGVWANGAIQADQVVASGAITLDTAATVAQIGLRYRHRAKPLKIADGNPSGTALGKTKRIYGITYVLLNSHTMSFGPSSTDLKTVEFRKVADPMDAGAPLFTGEYFQEFHGGYDGDVRIVFESDDPCPFTILALAPEIQVSALK